MNILITGLMGSGKSTQAKRLAEKLGLVFLTTDILREAAKRGDDMGRQLREALSKGKMVDDRIVADLTRNRLSKPDANRGFVSDSYPRRVSQIDFFDPKIEKVFYLKVEPEVAKKRLLKRGRPDDTSELIDFRHKTQVEGIKEVVGYYKEKIKVVEIDANKSEDEVFQQILNNLNGS